MKEKHLLILLFLIIAVGLISLFVIKDNGTRCMVDPFRYIAEEYKDEGIRCSCFFDDKKYIPFYFDSYGKTPLSIGNESKLNLMNYTIPF